MFKKNNNGENLKQPTSNKLKFTVAILSALVVTAGLTTAYFAVKANQNTTDTGEVYIDPSIKSNFEIGEFKDVPKGKEVSITSKNTDKIIDTVAVSIGNDLLKLNEEYSFSKSSSSNNETKSSCTVTIFKAALSSHKGIINIKPELIDKTFTVTFDSNGGSTVPSQTIKKGEKAVEPNSTKDKFKLKGWYKGTSKDPFNFNTPITSDITLKAQWEESVVPATKYTVTFISNSKTYMTQEVEENKYASKPTTDPVIEGKKFNYWHKQGQEDTPFNFATTPITADLTLYANFDNLTYTVTFDTNGAEEKINPVVVNYGEKVTEPTDELTKTGYHFVNWLNENEIEYDFKSPVYSDITLTANWAIDTFTVSFDTDGGSYIASQTIEYDNYATKPSDPTKDGYTFIKWVDEDENEFDFENTPITANVTIKAIWKANYEDYLEFEELEDGSYSVGQSYPRSSSMPYYLNIPKTYKDKNVTEINSNGFSDNPYVCAINIPNTITKIANNAFSGSKLLSVITFESDSQLITIEGNAFLGSSIREISFPDSIESFGDYSHFYNCSNLYKVKLPSNANFTTLPSSIFANCINLYTVGEKDGEISLNNIATIQTSCFEKCKSIKQVNFDSSISQIDYDSFNDCTNLATITYAGTVEEWKSVTRVGTWHANVPATTVICSDGSCGLDDK